MTTVKDFLIRAERAAHDLGDQATLELIQSLRTQGTAPRLRLLVVGASGTGRFGVVNSVLGKSEVLPSTSLPQAPLPVVVCYGPTTTVEVVRSDGLSIALPEAALGNFLTSAETDLAAYQTVHIAAPVDLLKIIDLRIESIDSDRTPADRKEILAGSDYALLVLRATALLSDREKRFVRDVLTPWFGLQRVAVILNQMDLVPEQERDSVIALTRAFIGSFENPSPILPYSAVAAASGTQVNAGGPDAVYADLVEFLSVDLLHRHGDLKSASMWRTAETCLAELSRAAERQRALLMMDEDEMQRLLDRSQSRSEWVGERIGRAQNRINLYIKTVVKERFLREVEGFAQAIRTHLPSEIEPIQDMVVVKKHLPSYVEALWAEFFSNRMDIVRAALAAETTAIGAMIKEDLREMLGDRALDFEDVLQQFDPAPVHARAVIVSKRSDHEGAKLATGLGVGGLLVAVINLPAAVTMIGAGQVLRMLQKKTSDAADKQAIMASTLAATYEMEREIKQQVETHFLQLAEQLCAAIEETYNGALRPIHDALETVAQQRERMEIRRIQIEELTDQIIPELRQMLAESGWRDISDVALPSIARISAPV